MSDQESGGPSVSVLVTTFNHGAYVEEALESLRLQTTDDFEVIITDDASPDGTADVIQGWLDRTGYQATFIRNDRNRGICFNRNQALALAKGEFVCSLSGDDAYEPERIERQLACFRELPDDVVAVFSDMATVDAEGRDLGRSLLTRVLDGRPVPEPHDVHRRLLLEGNFLPAPATLVRRTGFAAVGPYDESLSFEDHDMWLRLSHRFTFHFLPGELVRYRMLETSLSRHPDRLRDKRDSSARLLSSWVGRCATPEDEAALSDRLWGIGRAQLAHGDVVGARLTLSTAARAGGQWHRRAIARTVGLPGGPSLARRVANARGSLPATIRARMGDPS